MNEYEYRLVEANQVNAYLQDGWEPAPNTHQVITGSLVQVFLRRLI